MKLTFKKLLIAANLILIGAPALSSEVTLTTTFVDGNVLTADELNGNNIAIKTAVDDNQSQITTNASAINDQALLIAELQAQIAEFHLVEIGDVGPAGGLVFYITDGGKHGLEAAPVDQSDGSGAEWGCNNGDITGADGTGIGDGAQNTADILMEGCVSDGGGGIAADLVDAYSLNGYDDWFLPSKDELNLMYNNLQINAIGGFVSAGYWSSSEYSGFNTAWNQFFGSGSVGDLSRSGNYKVRAIRSF